MQNAFSAQRAKCTPGIDIWSLKETVKMRQEKGGRTRRANLDLKSWNKMLRSDGPARVLFGNIYIQWFSWPARLDKWTRPLYGSSDFYCEEERRRNEDFHSDAISRELTLRRGRRGTEAYRIIGLLAISVKTCESAAKGEVQSHYIRIKRYKAGYIAEFLSFDADA